MFNVYELLESKASLQNTLTVVRSLRVARPGKAPSCLDGSHLILYKSRLNLRSSYLEMAWITNEQTQPCSWAVASSSIGLPEKQKKGEKASDNNSENKRKVGLAPAFTYISRSRSAAAQSATRSSSACRSRSRRHRRRGAIIFGWQQHGNGDPVTHLAPCDMTHIAGDEKSCLDVFASVSLIHFFGAQCE